MTHRHVIRLLLLGVILAPATVRASETFPGTIKDAWQVLKLPVKGEGCLLCHATDPGKKDNVNRPFGLTVKAHGAKKADPSSLRRALTSVRAMAVNSDGDPVSDYQEIAIDGTNPNDPKSFVPPTVVKPEGGAGGDGGASGVDGTGGDMGVDGPHFPPADFSGPPPFEHGCSLAASPDEGWKSALGVFALVAAAARIMRRARIRPKR